MTPLIKEVIETSEEFLSNRENQAHRLVTRLVDRTSHRNQTCSQIRMYNRPKQGSLQCLIEIEKSFKFI